MEMLHFRKCRLIDRRAENRMMFWWFAHPKVNPFPSAWKAGRAIPNPDPTNSKMYPTSRGSLLKHLLGMADNGLPLPVVSLRSPAHIIAHHHSEDCQLPHSSQISQPPGKNWPQGFYRLHPELKARKLKAINRNRDDCRIEEKIREWLTVIGKELNSPTIPSENVYNMDETGVL